MQAIEDRLPTAAKAAAAAHLGNERPPTMFGLLRAWRRLGRIAEISSHDRSVLRQRFVTQFAALFHEERRAGRPGFAPEDFGLRSSSELAEVFVATLERTEYAKRKLSTLPKIRSILVGELLERLVANSRELQDMMKEASLGQLRFLRRSGVELFDAAGETVARKGIRFEAPVAASDLSINGRKFIDSVRVSIGTHSDGRRFITFLYELEIKMPAAARKAGRQVGRAQVRFDMQPGEKLLLDVAGRGPMEFDANEIVFSPQSIDRSLVTIGKADHFRLRSTSAGGYDEVFWEISVQMEASSLRRLVDSVIP